MPSVDIRPLKRRMREEIKAWRRAMSPQRKSRADKSILSRLTRLREYQGAQTVLTYVSLPIEVDTFGLIQKALEDGKRVAVPRCVEGTRLMEFYLIHGVEDLEPGTFGVLEPNPKRCTQLRDFRGSLCIVPALAYDRSGYRLGYGAGYYDRFLSSYSGQMVGIVYERNLRWKLWRGHYDVPVKLVVTERGVHPCRPQKKTEETEKTGKTVKSAVSKEKVPQNKRGFRP